jgi:hypothetical protein
MRFDSKVEVIAPFPSFGQEAIREEISQARVPVGAAMSAGPAHRAFIAALPEAWRRDPGVEVFSRLVWLKPGWYPLGPHYHLDWHQGVDGPVVETMMVMLGGASRTEFVVGSFDLPDGGDMRAWGEIVGEGVRTGRLETWHFEPDRLIRFDNRAWHRARPAQATGWRLLVRAIRGLPADEARRSAPFTSARNGFVADTPEDDARFAPYRL